MREKCTRGTEGASVSSASVSSATVSSATVSSATVSTVGARVKPLLLVIALCGQLALFVAPVAAASFPPIVRPSSRPMFVTFNFGPSVGVDPSGTLFKIAQEFGYHIFHTGSGPAVGASFEEAFSGNLTRLGLGPKFWWNFQPVAGLGLYLTPSAKIGYQLASYTEGQGSNHYFLFQFGFEGRLVIGDRGLIFFRPFTLEMGGGGGDISGQGFIASYDIQFGGGVTF